ARAAGATVLVVSLADSGRATLQLAMATGPAPGGEAYGDSLLSSGSTRQSGLIQTTDVTPTLVAALGLEQPGAAFGGAPIVPAAGPGGAAARMPLLEDIPLEARQVPRVSGSYLPRLVLTQAVFFVAAALLLPVRRPADRPPMRPAL